MTGARTRIGRWALGLAAALAVLVAPAVAAAQESPVTDVAPAPIVAAAPDAASPATVTPTPSGSVSPTSAPIGGSVTVAGTGWPADSLVGIEVCGNGARRGSSDCAPSAGAVAGANSTGQFASPVTILEPPVPCPCVVKLTGLSTPATVLLPLTISGHPDVGAGQSAGIDVVRDLEISSMSVDGGGSFTSWLGGTTERTLVMTVRNTGNVAITDPRVVLAVGKGSDPTGIIPSPSLGTIPGGTQTTYRIPFEVGPLAFGDYTVTASIPGFAPPVQASTSTTVYPWLLLIIPAVLVVQLVLILVRNRVRARVWAKKEATATLEEQILLAEADMAPVPVAAPSVAAAGVALSSSEAADAERLLRSLDDPDSAEVVDRTGATSAPSLDELAVAAGALAAEMTARRRAFESELEAERRRAAEEIAAMRAAAQADIDRQLAEAREQSNAAVAAAETSAIDETERVQDDARRQLDDVLLALRDVRDRLTDTLERGFTEIEGLQSQLSSLHSQGVEGDQLPFVEPAPEAVVDLREPSGPAVDLRDDADAPMRISDLDMG